MRLKICGIRTNEMLRACQGGQVDFVGFNFVPNSRRRVLRMPEGSSRHRFKRVGIFRDQPLDFILASVRQHDLDIVQLHGHESLELIDKLHEKEITIWKAVSVDENLDLDLLQQYCKKCDLILFDGANPGSGTEISHPELLLEGTLITKRAGVKIGLAGGINTDNVANFKAKFPEAYLLDTASGIEVNGDFSVTETKRLINKFHE